MKTPWSTDEWKRVVVYGLGSSGLAAARFLVSQGVAVIGVDQRSDVGVDLAAESLESSLLGVDDVELPGAVDAVVLSPGVPGHRRLLVEARESGLPVLSEVELAFPYLRGPVVAVTGSNGKSSTVAMTAGILEQAGLQVELCGNIGEPLCSKIEGPPGRVFVVELSSFQLEEISLFRADCAALLNLSPDHLDRYESFGDYVSAKTRIFERQTADSTAVLNADDERVAAIGEELPRGRLRYFSRAGEVRDGCYADGSEVVEVSEEGEVKRLFSKSDLRVAGLHNLENAMAAALLARSRGVDAAAVRRGLAEFRGLPHRLEEVRKRHGVVWFDDSKGTNVGATEKSLEGFADHSVHLILGGRAKGTDPSALRDAVERKARRLYLIGESADEFEEALGACVDSENVGTLERAIFSADEQARPGEVVLLSPACASFDQFESFEHRGECFQALVNALNGESGVEEARL